MEAELGPRMMSRGERKEPRERGSLRKDRTYLLQLFSIRLTYKGGTSPTGPGSSMKQS